MMGLRQHHMCRKCLAWWQTATHELGPQCSRSFEILEVRAGKITNGPFWSSYHEGVLRPLWGAGRSSVDACSEQPSSTGAPGQPMTAASQCERLISLLMSCALSESLPQLQGAPPLDNSQP